MRLQSCLCALIWLSCLWQQLSIPMLCLCALRVHIQCVTASSVNCTTLTLLVCLQANSVRLYWNSTGTALLAITAADVDVTNQSYYGEQKIHYLAADGTNDCLVPNLKVHIRCDQNMSLHHACLPADHHQATHMQLHKSRHGHSVEVVLLWPS